MTHREKELRCFCSRSPLLATYGIRKGVLFVHVKVYKQHRIMGELVAEGGTVKLRCRDCLRWHVVRIGKSDDAILEETDCAVPLLVI